MKINNRLDAIGVYHFKTIDSIKEKRRKEGKKIIDLSIGDPDLPVDPSILKAVVEGFQEDGFNKYPPYDGINCLKKEVVDYYKNRFGVYLDLEEVVILIGSKEGISNIIPAVCDINDVVIVPEPGYPVYSAGAKLWGCVPYTVPIKEINNFLMDFKQVPKDVCAKAKLMFINYPNNPTGASGNGEFFSDVIRFCEENNIVLCNDGAYSEIIKPGENPLSILQFDKNKYSIEFGTFSKLYNMTGFRIGYAVGNKEVISALVKVKSNLDSGQFMPIQKAACKALNLEPSYGEEIREVYSKRRAVAEKILREKNIQFFSTESTFYIWCKTPKGYTTHEFCSEVLDKYGVVVTPGSCFGTLGYDYFRIALTCPWQVIQEGLSSLPVYSS